MTIEELLEQVAYYYNNHRILITCFSFKDSTEQILYRVYFKHLPSSEVFNPLVDKKFHAEDSYEKALAFILGECEKFVSRKLVNTDN